MINRMAILKWNEMKRIVTIGIGDDWLNKRRLNSLPSGFKCEK